MCKGSPEVFLYQYFWKVAIKTFTVTFLPKTQQTEAIFPYVMEGIILYHLSKQI
jgi:hypothetical protein